MREKKNVEQESLNKSPCLTFTTGICENVSSRCLDWAGCQSNGVCRELFVTLWSCYSDAISPVLPTVTPHTTHHTPHKCFFYQDKHGKLQNGS